MRFIHENLYALFSVLVFIAVVSCWLGTTLPEDAHTSIRPEDTWSLAQLPEHDSGKSITTITTRNLWGNVVADAPKPPEWHILGIAMTGTDRFILLAYEGRPVETLKIGDSLPDGAKIVQIEKDRFFVMTQNKKRLAFGIYKHDQAK